MSSQLVIALYGMHGLYNFGCEAILRGTEAIIRTWKPDAEIRYYSLNYEQDCKILANSSVRVFERTLYPRWHISRIVRKLSFICGLPCKSMCEDVRWLYECDIVLSVGGDLYTEEFTLRRFPWFVWNNEVVFGYKALQYGRKLILWGASIGPFNSSCRQVMFTFLKRVDLIAVRETVTLSYLHQQLPEITSLKLIVDPAFGYSPANSPPQTHCHHNRRIIGINISPRSLQVIGIIPDDAAIAKLAKIVVAVSRECNADILLVPHVLAVDPADNDALFLKKLYAVCCRELHDAIQCATVTSFDEAHIALGSCDVVIAARMHCAINALMAGVPTIFLGYSQKAEGMARYYYKKKIGYLPMQMLDENSLVTITNEFLNNIESYRQFVSVRSVELRDSALSTGFFLEEIRGTMI